MASERTSLDPVISPTRDDSPMTTEALLDALHAATATGDAEATWMLRILLLWVSEVRSNRDSATVVNCRPYVV